MGKDACCETCERFGDGANLEPISTEAPMTARPASARIVVTYRGESSVHHPTGERVVFGRVSGNDVVLPSGTISKRQLAISFLPDRVVVADLKSTCGTYVDGRKISTPTELRDGSVIYAGDFQIRVESD